MDPILFQKQVRDNSQDVQDCLKDLKSWESEMKRKENELLVLDSDSHPTSSNSGSVIVPPVRNKKQRIGKNRTRKAVPQCKASTTDGVPALDKDCTAKRIPGNDYASWDKFDVDRACQEVDVEQEDSGEGTESEEESIESTRFQEEAMYEKEKGNQFVKLQKWEEAIQCYSRAIDCYPFDAIFYANRALCFLKTSRLKNAETDCSSAITLDTTYVKAYQRRAAARSGLGMLEEAKSDLEKVMVLEPKNTASKEELAKIVKKINAMQKQTKCIINEEKKKEDGSGESDKGGTDLGLDSVLGKQLIQPISKPPHLRSKKPLKKIEIQESEEFSASTGNNAVDDQVTKISTANNSEIQELVYEESELVENGNKKRTVPVAPKDTKPTTSKEVDMQSLSSKIMSNDGNAIVSTPQMLTTLEESKKLPIITSNLTIDITNIPPPPKSYVEFYVGWKKVKKNPQQRYLYLKQCPGEELSKVFQESLESATFSELLSTLETGFLASKEPVFPYLLGISNVKRLSTLTMFLTNEDRERIKVLLRNCVQSGECNDEQAAMLTRKFEIF